MFSAHLDISTFTLPLVGVPRQLLDLNLARLRERFLQLIQQDSGGLTSDVLGIRREWKSEKAKEILDWVRQNLELRIQN